MNLNDKKVAIIGLGYVGLPLAAEFGKSRPVVGFDINLSRIAELRSGKDSTLEVTPEDLAAARQGWLDAAPPEFLQRYEYSLGDGAYGGRTHAIVQRTNGLGQGVANDRVQAHRSLQGEGCQGRCRRRFQRG